MVLFPDQLLTKLVSYFSAFGHKAVCASDLKLFISSLESSGHMEFFSLCKNSIQVREVSEERGGGTAPATVGTKMISLLTRAKRNVFCRSTTSSVKCVCASWSASAASTTP